MKKQAFTLNRDGFCGTYHPAPVPGGKTMIAMLSNSSEGRMVASAVRWLHERGCSVLALSPGTEDGGYHDIPLEIFGKAIAFFKSQGCEKIGIVGASTTGMIALLAASLCPEITLTIAFTPPDFIMEGFSRGRRDGAPEWPSGGSSVTWKGQPLPYLPYACRIRNTGGGSWRIPRPAGTASPVGPCSRNRSGSTPFRKRKESRWRTSAAGSSSWARRTTHCGTPAGTSAE